MPVSNSLILGCGKGSPKNNPHHHKLKLDDIAIRHHPLARHDSEKQFMKIDFHKDSSYYPHERTFRPEEESKPRVSNQMNEGVYGKGGYPKRKSNSKMP